MTVRYRPTSHPSRPFTTCIRDWRPASAAPARPSQLQFHCFIPPSSSRTTSVHFRSRYSISVYHSRTLDGNVSSRVEVKVIKILNSGLTLICLVDWKVFFFHAYPSHCYSSIRFINSNVISTLSQLCVYWLWEFYRNASKKQNQLKTSKELVLRLLISQQFC